MHLAPSVVIVIAKLLTGDLLIEPITNSEKPYLLPLDYFFGVLSFTFWWFSNIPTDKNSEKVC